MKCKVSRKVQVPQNGTVLSISVGKSFYRPQIRNQPQIISHIHNIIFFFLWWVKMTTKKKTEIHQLRVFSSLIDWLILNELITFTSTKQMENWTNYCDTCFKCFRLLFSEGMTAAQKVGGRDVTLVFGQNRCCVLSTAPFKSTKHFLAEPYLYHQVFIRIKQILNGSWFWGTFVLIRACRKHTICLSWQLTPAALHPPPPPTHTHTCTHFGSCSQQLVFNRQSYRWWFVYHW